MENSFIPTLMKVLSLKVNFKIMHHRALLRLKLETRDENLEYFGNLKISKQKKILRHKKIVEDRALTVTVIATIILIGA